MSLNRVSGRFTTGTTTYGSANIFNSSGSLDFQCNVGAVYVGRYSDDAVLLSVNNADTGTRVNVNTQNAGVIGLAVKGAAAQTADLQQWQNSAGTVLFSVLSNGTLKIASDNWHKSTDGLNRIFFSGAGSTLYGTGDRHEFRNSVDIAIFTIGANGTIATGTTAGAPTLASAATIAPVTPIAFVSGVTTINTITAPAPISTNGGSIEIIPTGLWSTGITGNIALATVAAVNKTLRLTYDPITTKWTPSY